MLAFTIALSLFGIAFIIMGMYYRMVQNPKIANFYANTKTLTEENIIDKKAYNNICGKIFIIWGVLNTIIAIVSYFIGDYFVFLLILIPIINIMAMAMYNINAAKYIKKG